MEQEQLRRLQLRELSALKDIDKVCKQLGVTYFLYGGSVIGAVRHNGFIPWDDDIDIAMYREDYDKFAAGAQALLGDAYSIETYDINTEHHLCFIKLYINGTVYAQPQFINKNVHQGVFIDIFPIDGVPDSKFGRVVQKYQTMGAYFLLRGEPISQMGRIVNFLSKIFLKLTTKKFRHRLGVWMDKRATRHIREKCKCISNLYGMASYEKEMMPKEYIGTPVPWVFEGMECKIPQMYHAYLTHLYGDYMQLPPEEERVCKHQGLECKF